MLRTSFQCSLLVLFAFGNLLIQGVTPNETGQNTVIQVASNNNKTLESIIPAGNTTPLTTIKQNASEEIGNDHVTEHSLAGSSDTVKPGQTIEKINNSSHANTSGEAVTISSTSTIATEIIESTSQGTTILITTAASSSANSTDKNESPVTNSSTVTTTTTMTTTTTTTMSTIITTSTNSTETAITSDITETSTQTISSSTPEEVTQSSTAKDVGMSSGIIALVMAISFAVVVIVVYAGLLLWRRYLEYRYGNRELLVNDLEFDTNDLRHFEL